MEEAPGVHISSWIVYRLNHTPPLCQPLSTQKPSETLPARRDSKPISANNAVTQLSLRIVLADQDMLPKSLWILLAAGEVCCVKSPQGTASFSVRLRIIEMAAYCCVVIKSQVTWVLSSLWRFNMCSRDRSV